MHHRKTGRKLSRTSSHRKALFRNLVAQLIRHERICTTEAKAKELRRTVEKMITLAKKGDLHARRSAFAFLRDDEAVQKLFRDIVEPFRNRTGGYLHMYKVRSRRGDGAPLCYIEFAERSQAKS
jgi:large subunit ribosomal protein L17